MRALWIPREESGLQARLRVCAHMQKVGHRGVCATVHRLPACCVWDGIENDVVGFVW